MFFDTRECEWSDVQLLIDGVKVTKVQGVKYKSSQEKEFLYAAGDEPIGIQRGNKAYIGTITLLKGAVDDLNRFVRAAGGNDILDGEFVAVVAYKSKGNRALQTDTLVGLQFTDYEKGMEQNAKSMPIPLPIMFMRLIPS